MKKWIAAILLVFCFSVFLYGCAKTPQTPDNGGSVVTPLPDGGEAVPPDDGDGSESVTPPDNGGNEVVPPDNGGETAPPDNGGETNPPDNGGDVTPPPAPQPATDVLVVSKTDGLAVRAGRGTSYKKLGEINSGDMLAYTKLSGGWYEVYYKNGFGYVSSAYLTTFAFEKADAKTESVITAGKKLMGLPYVFGAPRYHWGNGVKNAEFTGKSYDCSSLIQYIFKIGANVNLDTTSRAQSVQGKYVGKSALKRGDVLFFTNDSRTHLTGLERIGHVGLYLGDNYILHTASDYAVIEEISAKRWSYFVTARRML